MEKFKKHRFNWVVCVVFTIALILNIQSAFTDRASLMGNFLFAQTNGSGSEGSGSGSGGNTNEKVQVVQKSTKNTLFEYKDSLGNCLYLIDITTTTTECLGTGTQDCTPGDTYESEYKSCP